MNQKGVAVLFLLLVIVLVGSIITIDVIKNDRLHLNPAGPKDNWQWKNDWQNQSPPVQPQNGPQNQPEQPEQPKKPEPPMSQISAESYSKALELSGEYGMPVLAIFEADWCGWCKKLKNETLTDEKVKDVMMNYVVVHVNVDRNRKVSRKFGVSGIPAYVITNWKEQKLKKGAGYKSGRQFASWLNEPKLWQQPKNGQQKNQRH